jgi:hypothetical protein
MRATYCFDTVFQACIYFSMHEVKQVSSPFERDAPGLGTQRSKQCSFNFYRIKSVINLAFQNERIGSWIVFLNCLRTSTSMRAFCMAASCCTWRMICCLGSLGKDERPNESILAVIFAKTLYG